MRDAFGGAFMIKLFLVFIIIYVSFTALALNYAKAFKVKNKIVEYIESHEEVNISRMSAEELMSMENFFEKEIRNGMNYTGNASCGKSSNEVYCKDGIKIERIGTGSNAIGEYYRVTTYFGWNIHFFNVIRSLNGNNSDKEDVIGTWKISGETRLIVHDN